LRDEAAEREAYAAEVERLRAERLPVLTAQEAEEADGPLVLEDMRTPEGEPVPVEDWPNLSGVAVIVTEDWEYPEADDSAGEGDDEDEAYSAEYDEPVKFYRQMWIVTDIEASGLVQRSRVGRTDDDQGDDTEAHDAEADSTAEVEAEARREERRRVIASNKAWTSVLLTEPPSPFGVDSPER
jgi:ParB family chromosome partitioning protein